MSAKVEIYSTSWCPFCVRAMGLLRQKNVSFINIDVEENPEKRVEMRERAGRNTVPQIWINDYHVGGCDELFALQAKGELDKLLAEEK